MRLASLGLTSLLLASAALSAQQASAPTTATSESQASVPSSTPAPASSTPGQATQPKVEDAKARDEAKATERARKDQAKVDAKAQKEAEKQRKLQEEDAKYLKLEDNEIAVSVFDDNGNPVTLAPCAHKDSACQEKRREILKQKRIPLSVQNGALSIDGLVTRLHLNFDVPSLLYLYISLPGYGTVVVSPVHFPHSIEAKDAIDGRMLTFKISDDHFIELAGEKSLSGHGKRTIFYSVDHTFHQPGRYPIIGYGTLNRAPYVWPSAAPIPGDQKRHTANAPELPRGMVAEDMSVPCQTVSPGGSLKPVKVNGVTVIPQACKSTQVASAPAKFNAVDQGSSGSAAPTATATQDDRSR